MEWIVKQSPILLALIGGVFTWLCTALGASSALLIKGKKAKSFALMIGFSSGIMFATSFWSLLTPAFEIASDSVIPSTFIVTIGFLLGVIFLVIFEQIIKKIENKKSTEFNGTFSTNITLIISITLHNIPEGLAIGLAFGSLYYNNDTNLLLGAMSLALSIGLQNIPEGVATSMPLLKNGVSNFKSFWYGQLSAIVEPIASLIGCALIFLIEPVLPYALSFAAGAMIYVVIDELLPLFSNHKEKRYMTCGFIVGFIVMMMLDTLI